MKGKRKPLVECCWALVGQKSGPVWNCCRLQRSCGDASSVQFDSKWVLSREQKFGDILGFMHTHPRMPATPSERDIKTMKAWCSCFGKPLLCVIAGGYLTDAETKGYVFTHARIKIVLDTIVSFPKGNVVIGVEKYDRKNDNKGSKRKVPPRSRIPRRRPDSKDS